MDGVERVCDARRSWRTIGVSFGARRVEARASERRVGAVGRWFRGSLTSRLGRSEKLGQVGGFGNEASKSVVGNALKTRVRPAEALSSERVEARWRKRHERS
jgi:hypothetical protein